MKNKFALIRKLFLLLITLVLNQGIIAQDVGVSIIVTFDSIPTVTVTKAPLKYNKHFALSFHIEDGGKDIYTHAFKYLNGGTIDNVTYPGLFYTDGCGNDVPFKMSTSLFSFNNDQDIDLHDPYANYASSNLTWTEIIELYQAGWGIYNQGLTSSNSGDPDYLIGRNHSYIKLMTQDATNNGISAKVLVNPQDDISFSSPAFNQNYDAALRDYAYGVPYLDVSNPALITDIDSLKMGRTNLIGTTSLGKIADTLDAYSSWTVNNWASTYNKSITGDAAGYTFDVFKFYMNYIATKYGKDSTDNIWMASEEEVLDYVTINKLVTLNTEILGNQLLITFNGTLPTDLRYYSLSVLINSNATITDIEVNGGENNTHRGVTYEGGMVNINWDGRVVVSKTVNAETYVSIAESTESQNDILIAMDYVNMLESGQTMLDFRARLCAIPSATLPDGWCDCNFSLGNDTIICLGDSITLTAPYGVSYGWNTGATTRSIKVSPTEHTQYTATVYNDQGCYSSDTKLVVVTSSEFATVTAAADSICANTCVEITATASNGLYYLWSTGETTSTNTVCPAETSIYNVTVTNVFGCVDIDTVTIYTYSEPTIQISNDTVICQSDCISLTASGGYQYSWSSGQTTNTIEVCPEVTTTYYVTVTNDNNCSSIDSVTVTVINLPDISLNSDTTICLNNCVELTASGGNTYLWSTGQTTNTIEVCPEETTKYFVNVFVESGCLSKDSITINVLPIPTTIVSNDTTVCPNSCVTLTAEGGNSYLWSTGETTNSIEVCPSVPTTFYITVFHENGCSILDSIQINHFRYTNAYAGEDQTICPGDEATLLATGGYSYLWNTGLEYNSIKVSPTETTTYFVTVTTENACPATDTVIVNVLIPPLANAGLDTIICADECVLLTASGGIEYIWNNGSESAENEVCPNETASYFVTVFDEFGCSSVDSVNIFTYPGPNIQITNDTSICITSCITLSASGGIAYSWSSGADTNFIEVCPVETTTYYVTVTDHNNCSAIDSVIVTVLDLPSIELTSDTSICINDCIELAVTGGTTFLWGTGETIQAIEVCPNDTTTYTINVFDANGCMSIDSVTINILQAPIITISSDTSICPNTCINISASGGTSYLWSNGDTTQTIEVCLEDTTKYFVNVFTVEGCLSTDSVTVNVLPLPTSIVSNDTTVCPGDCVNLNAAGGESYLWSTGETTDSIEVCPTVPTKYYVTIYNEYGCGVLDSIQITHWPYTNAYAGEDKTICPGDEVTLLATGGYSYLWSTGSEYNAITVSPIETTTYFVTVVTEEACPATDTVIVNVLPAPVANAGMDTTICVDECILLTASGGVDYVWNNGSESAENEVCPDENTSYYITVFDSLGCYDSDTVQVNIAEVHIVSFTGLENVYCDVDDGSLLEASIGGGIFSGAGISNNIFYPAIAGVGTHEITYTLENENGCPSISTQTTTIYSPPEVALGNDTTICTGASLTLEVTSGFDSYLWSNGDTEFSTVITSGGITTTTVIQLNATNNGCVTIEEIQITFIACVGIDNLAEKGIYIYPNPTTGKINIRFNTEEKDIRLDIINLQGQIIYQEELRDCNQSECVKTINLSGYTKGIYIVRFSNKNFIQTAKLLIN